MRVFNKRDIFKTINFRSIVVIGISICLLWLTVYKSGLNWQNFKLTGRQLAYLVLSMPVFLFTIWVQSIRAKIPWEPWFKKQSIDTFNGIALGNFYNCMLPGNLGEGIRAWHFSRKNGVSFTRALASLGVEKYIDAFGFVIYTLVLLSIYPVTNQNKYFVFGIAAIVFVIALYIAIISVRGLERLLAKFLFGFARAGRWLYKFYYQIKVMLTSFGKWALFRYIILGCCLFMLNVVQYYIVMKATGLPVPIMSLHTSFLISVAMVVVGIIPSAPGNVGVIHYGIYSLLIFTAKVNGIVPDGNLLQIFALYTVYLHLSYFLPEVALGFIVLLKEKQWLF